MNRGVAISLALAALLSMAAMPLQAKKPDGEEALPKGLQKKVERGGELPPGWEMKLQKGAVLEQVVVDHGTPVPPEVKVTLPVGQSGSVDISLDGRIVRLHEKTRQILDIFEVRR